MFRKILDIVFCIFTIPIFFPLILFICVTNLVFLGPPIFFIQKRSGLNGKTIKIIKFRSMKYFNQKEKSISSYGLFLRNSKIDEIPQIINLIKNDLTLIGPRPLYLEYNKLYSKEHRKRLLMKPGLTGWAQVNEFIGITWKKKFDLDLWYYYNRNLLIDFLIIFKTIKKISKAIFKRDQFSKKMTKFRGY